MANERKQGTVIRIVRDKGYGFIQCSDDQRDYFFHFRELIGCTLQELHDGTGEVQPSAVTFSLGVEPKKGRMQAEDVRLVGA